MNAHLFLDVLSGLVLLCSPWVFGFASYISTPHVILGAIEIVVPLLTRTHPSHEVTPEPHRP